MRLNLEFSEERINDLRRLRDETGTQTMKDLVNNAFTILEWAINETRAGNEIAAVNERDHIYRVLVTEILQRAARTPAAAAANR